MNLKKPLSDGTWESSAALLIACSTGILSRGRHCLLLHPVSLVAMGICQMSAATFYVYVGSVTFFCK